MGNKKSISIGNPLYDNRRRLDHLVSTYMDAHRGAHTTKLWTRAHPPSMQSFSLQLTQLDAHTFCLQIMIGSLNLNYFYFI